MIPQLYSSSFSRYINYAMQDPLYTLAAYEQIHYIYVTQGSKPGKIQ